MFPAPSVTECLLCVLTLLTLLMPHRVGREILDNEFELASNAEPDGGGWMDEDRDSVSTTLCVNSV